MANKQYNLYLDLSGSGMVPHIEIRRNDYDSNSFIVQVTQNGLPFDFTGMNPIFECLTPDGHYIRDDGSQYGTFSNINAAQGTFEYTLVNEIFAVLGQIDVAYFAFEQSNPDLENPVNRVSTGNFTFAVIADALTGTTAAADYMSDVTTLINNINQLKTDYVTLNPANYAAIVQLGDITQLDTTDKSSAVNAINEVKSQANGNATAIANIGNASPKGTYATLSALQTAFPTGTAGIYVVTADGNWYYWSGSAWTAGGVYQSTGLANGSVTLPTVASDTRSKINFGITSRAKPYIWSGGSISKTINSVTFSGTIGGIVGVGTSFIINPASFTGMVTGDVIVAQGLDFDSVHSSVPVTPVKISYLSLTGNEVVLAWKDDYGVNTIYDFLYSVLSSQFSTINNYWQLAAKPWLTASADAVSKTVNSITFSISVGLIYNGNVLYINPGTYSCSTIGYVLVIQGFDSTKSFVGTPNPKFSLTSKSYTAVLPTDIVVAYKDGRGLWTIYDDFIATQTYLQKSDLMNSITFLYNDLLSKSYPTLASKILAKTDTINVLLVGDSIFATSGAWVHGVYDETKRFTTLLPTPSGEPLSLTNNILSRKIYEELISQALNVPVYRRFDYGHTFDYNPASGTYGQDITAAGAAFFTETGAFNTFINSNGNKGSDALYNPNVPMIKADFDLQSYPYAAWYNSGAMEGFTRVSSDANASIQFTIPAGYKKARIKLRYTTDGDVLTTALTNCTGSASIDTKFTGTGTNTSTFKDVEFAITDTTQPATITLTKSSDTTKLLAYWGCYYYNEPSVLVNNMAYGGTQTVSQLNVVSDNLGSAPVPYDLVLWEVSLLNDYYNSGYTAPATDYTAALNAISSYADSLSGINVIAIIPHRGAENDIHSAELWNKAKQVLIAKNIPFIDLNAIERQVSDYFGSLSAMIAYMFADGFVHPNINGVNILKKPLQAMLQCNQYNKI